jgi:5,10-methylenetetrahydrofolate reductase
VSVDFEVLWELEAVTRADRSAVAERVGAGAAVTDRFLVPDNPTASAAVSSLAVAREVRRAGGEPTACLNARDRNLLGLRRDLLTAAWHDVDDFLFVYGDEPDVGNRATGLTVRTMVAECRDQLPDARVGVTARLGRLPTWKRGADRLLVQVSWSAEELVRWREAVAFDGDVLPAVLVVPSAAMARRLSARLPQLAVPDALVDAVERDRRAGVDWACRLVADLRDTGAFAGVHLIAGVRGADVAARLAAMGIGGDPAVAHPAGGRRPHLRPVPDPAA